MPMKILHAARGAAALRHGRTSAQGLDHDRHEGQQAEEGRGTAAEITQAAAHHDARARDGVGEVRCGDIRKDDRSSDGA
jgi:hypothetical protein